MVLKARAGTRIVGSVRGRREGDTWHIGRLVVAPDRQGEGLGSRLLRVIEAAAEDGIGICALFTGERSDANLRLYARHGYDPRPADGSLRQPGLAYLAKRVSDTRA